MSQAVIGLVAHVDAGKTTLAEALLYRAGVIRRQGRVDKGDAHLDTDAMERERGITIFSKQTSLDWAGAHVMLLDTPGHVDFSAEAERTLRALDYAVLIVGANDGVEGHTETLWSLLARYNVPAFVFVNKLDLAADGLGPVMDEMHRRLSASIVDGAALEALAASAGGAGEGAAVLLEDVAATDEDALDEYLESGSLSVETIRRLIVQRKVFPCFAGSALRMEGIEEFLDGVVALMQEKAWPDEFAARVYRVSRGAHGERLAWVIILTHVLEREHPGVLTGAPLTDARITLLGGRAHLKHTEGGDFRQATYRAIRQALMTAREQGACQLLEPWYRFRLGVPADKVGRALADLQRMGADFDAPFAEGDRAEIAGAAPASEIGSYALDVSAYSGGRGRLFLEYAGYRPCHNAEQVIAEAAYDPVADLANTPGSVFCSHGAGYNVAWDQVPAQAHVEIDFDRLRPWRKADASFFAE